MIRNRHSHGTDPPGLDNQSAEAVVSRIERWEKKLSEEVNLLHRKLDGQCELLQNLIDSTQGEFDHLEMKFTDDRYEAPLSVKQLAQVLGKSESTIRRWERQGIISCERIPNEKQDTIQFYLSRVKQDLARNLKRAE